MQEPRGRSFQIVAKQVGGHQCSANSDTRHLCRDRDGTSAPGGSESAWLGAGQGSAAAGLEICPMASLVI